MDVSDLLSKEPSASGNGNSTGYLPRQGHSYPTRHTSSSYAMPAYGPYNTAPALPASYTNHTVAAATHTQNTFKQAPKTVNFQLLLSNTPHHRARLPLRVHINPHDTTESIITTVKNFYGLYEGEGVSFEDSNGVTLIAQYENLTHNATIHVRITSEQPESPQLHSQRDNGATSPQKLRLDDAFQMLPPQPYSRPSSRATKKRSASPPSARGRRSASAIAQSKPKPKSASWDDNDGAANGMSDSDAGSVSVSSSRRAKSDQLASAEISLDNIVEGGRRKRAKFESSELPLFAPPQQPMTASMSSLSPQRRLNNPNIKSPLPFNGQYNITYNYSLPSPQSYGNGDTSVLSNGSGGHETIPVLAQPHGHRLRGRASSGHGPSRLSGGSMSGVLPTPDPTIGSVISDEDVALQLMRLGDATNLSLGRTSTSTMDDALSGKAEAASSDEDSDEDSTDEEGLPPPMPAHTRGKPSHVSGPARKKQRVNEATQSFDSADTSGEDYEDYNDTSFKGESDALGQDVVMNGAHQMSAKSRSFKPHTSNSIVKAPAKSRASSIGKSKSKSSTNGKIPPSPYVMPPAVRKVSSSSTLNFQHQPPTDDEDLSTKPRCQRCRKSKKGCDRQRPCQRCKDAGIGIEGCVSEDEGNGRKGRYGRHMGVSLKKDDDEIVPTVEPPLETATNGYINDAIASDASKKRKR